MNREEYEVEEIGPCAKCRKPVRRCDKQQHDRNGAIRHWDCFIAVCKDTGSLGSRQLGELLDGHQTIEEYRKSKLARWKLLKAQAGR